MTTPQAAWLTRHAPSLYQRRDLHAYAIRQSAFCRYEKPHELWGAALMLTGGHPTVIVVVLPAWMFNGLATIAHIRSDGQVAVVRPFTPDYARWTGDWTRSVPAAGGGYDWIPWIPEGADMQAREAMKAQLRQENAEYDRSYGSRQARGRVWDGRRAQVDEWRAGRER